ncbi:CLUMA_CG020812, isoform A [Clunio marinus]|uniref:CLUMA_CG020812, isoform A n=1 Tax=Clunio marinus TaxID=568069 RepID=A0A1J1J799_9DIPT|nr:CLUMA_CG020812, isoform A [Clunio marinus]
MPVTSLKSIQHSTPQKAQVRDLDVERTPKRIKKKLFTYKQMEFLLIGSFVVGVIELSPFVTSNFLLITRAFVSRKWSHAPKTNVFIQFVKEKEKPKCVESSNVERREFKCVPLRFVSVKQYFNSPSSLPMFEAHREDKSSNGYRSRNLKTIDT